MRPQLLTTEQGFHKFRRKNLGQKIGVSQAPTATSLPRAGRCVDTFAIVTVFEGWFRSYSNSYRSFAYSALASLRMGMSGSASFQIVKKS